jgi:hypothetical protein
MKASLFGLTLPGAGVYTVMGREKFSGGSKNSNISAEPPDIPNE